MMARYSTYSGTYWSIITTPHVWKRTYIVIDQFYCIVSVLPSVSLVAQELTAVCEKWQYIGEELGVKQSSLRHIHSYHSDPGDCLREVLRERFESYATTWKDIVAALRTPCIGESHLADHLEVKYCPSEF